MVTLTQRDSFLFNGNTKAVEQQMSQILGLNGRVSFPVRRLGTLWRNDSWRPVITEWVRHPVGQATFNMSTFEWMSSCRMDDVSVTAPRDSIFVIACPDGEANTGLHHIVLA